MKLYLVEESRQEIFGMDNEEEVMAQIVLYSDKLGTFLQSDLYSGELAETSTPWFDNNYNLTYLGVL